MSAAPNDSPNKRRSGLRLLLDWRALLGIAVSIALLWYAFRNEDLGAVFREIGRADPLLYLLAAAAATFVFWIRAWRWRAILEPVAPGSKFRSRFAAVTIGFMGNNLLPARVGEFARVYAFSKIEPVPIVASLGSLVIERMFDGVTIVATLFLVTLLPDFPDAGGGVYVTVGRTLGIILVLAFVFLFVLVSKPEPTVRMMEKTIARLLPFRLRRPFIDALEAFLAGAGSLRDGRLMLRASAWSIVLWTVNAFGFYLGFLAFGIDLPFTAAVFLQAAIALAVSIPSGPGFFGPFEAATQFVLVSMWGAEPTQALAFALGFHIAGFIPVTLLGLYYAWRLGFSLRDVEKSEVVVERQVEKTTGVDPKRPETL